MFVVDYKGVFIEIPRMATTSLRGFFNHFHLGTPHVGHMHSPISCCQFSELAPFATIQDPTRWYPSFWRYFVDPPKTIEANKELQAYHLRLSRGNGFRGWLERVTVGRGPADPSDPMLLPISPSGIGQGTDSYQFRTFWDDRGGHGLFSYIFRLMTNRRTRVIRVCNLEEELDEVLKDLGIEVNDEMKKWRKKHWPINAVIGKPPLDKEMVDWILRADAELIDEYQPCRWKKAR